MRFRLQVSGTKFGSNFDVDDEQGLLRTLIGGTRRLRAIGFSSSEAELICAPHFDRLSGRAFLMAQFPVTVAESKMEEIAKGAWVGSQELADIDTEAELYRNSGMEIERDD